MSLELRDYQEVARDFLRDRGRAALFLDMGLGKTASSLRALEEHHLPALVVAPKLVAEETWTTETALWRPDLTAEAAMGSPKERARVLAGDAAVVSIGREVIGDIETRIPTGKYKTLILDELSGFKGRGARWKAARRYIKKHNVEHVWGLTGTPAPNGLLDLWPQIGLLDGGKRLGTGITGYRSRYFTPTQTAWIKGREIVLKWELKPGAEEKIWTLLEDIALAMKTEGRIKLPDRTYNDIKFTLPPKARKVYDEFKNELCVDLKDVFGEGEIHTAASVGVLTQKLEQIASGFLYVDDAEVREYQRHDLHTKRMDVVQEVIEGINSPVLVFYKFRPEREWLFERFGDRAHAIGDPGVIKAWNAGEIPILVAHPQAAGHGLNLQHGGHHIVWVSPTWDLEEWEQGNKRLYRSGQKHPVVIHTILADGTINMITRQSNTDKAATQDALLAHLESPV